MEDVKNITIDLAVAYNMTELLNTPEFKGFDKIDWNNIMEILGPLVQYFSGLFRTAASGLSIILTL